MTKRRRIQSIVRPFSIWEAFTSGEQRPRGILRRKPTLADSECCISTLHGLLRVPQSQTNTLEFTESCSRPGMFPLSLGKKFCPSILPEAGFEVCSAACSQPCKLDEVIRVWFVPFVVDLSTNHTQSVAAPNAGDTLSSLAAQTSLAGLPHSHSLPHLPYPYSQLS